VSGDDRSDSPEDGALDLVRFFRALSPAARREYEALATKDLDFGEDVAAERRAGGGTVGAA
jgi:hypothetical protein